LFPYTRIQMILAEDAIEEQDSFNDLFQDCVDNIRVKQYTERGAGLDDLLQADKEKIIFFCQKNNISYDSIQYMRESGEDLLIATERLPCEQPFQRLMVTYDGRVGMCCYDWGAQHAVGFTDQRSISEKNINEQEVINQAAQRIKGYELLINVKPPKMLSCPKEVISSLGDIWMGKELSEVRSVHQSGNVEKLDVCKNCTFKETYKWVKI